MTTAGRNLLGRHTFGAMHVNPSRKRLVLSAETPHESFDDTYTRDEAFDALERFGRSRLFRLHSIKSSDEHYFIYDSGSMRFILEQVCLKCGGTGFSPNARNQPCSGCDGGRPKGDGLVSMLREEEQAD